MDNLFLTAAPIVDAVLSPGLIAYPIGRYAGARLTRSAEIVQRQTLPAILPERVGARRFEAPPPERR
jgi:hypothetical protein